MKPSAKRKSALPLLGLLPAVLLLAWACDHPDKTREETAAHKASAAVAADNGQPPAARIEAMLKSNQWQAAARLTADSEETLGRDYAPLLRKVLRDFFVEAIKDGSEDEKFAVAASVVELKDSLLERRMHEALREQQNPRMLEQARWRMLWESYLDASHHGNEMTTFDEYIRQIPEAGGHYVQPAREDIVAVNRAINQAKHTHRATFRIIEPILKAGKKSTLFYLADSMFQTPHGDLLPWMVLLMNHPDPVISARAIMAIGSLQSIQGRRRLLHFVAGNRPLATRVFAARVLWKSEALPAAPEQPPENTTIRVIPGGAAQTQPGAGTPAGSAPAPTKAPQ